MSESGCLNNECTVGQTGICLLNNQPDKCPNRVSGHGAAIGGDASLTHDEPVLVAPEDTPRFPPSDVLGMDEVRALMGKEYCHIIGLLGAPASGKTACLVSLYLLLAHNSVDGFTFADSRSLMALDELSRGARTWCGGMPEQMTVHTELKGGRSAGLLHFKLIRKSDYARLHLLIPDLPGEWSTSLIENNRTARLSFLRAADAIWVMVDGQTLIETASPTLGCDTSGKHANRSHRSTLLSRHPGCASRCQPLRSRETNRRDLATAPGKCCPVRHRSFGQSYRLLFENGWNSRRDGYRRSYSSDGCAAYRARRFLAR